MKAGFGVQGSGFRADPRPPASEPSSVLITGAAKRVGREIALHLAQRGYGIALHYNQSEAEARATQAEIRSLSVPCEIFQADLTAQGAPQTLINQVMRAMPGCRHLVNNASIFVRGALSEAGEDSYDAHMNANLKAPILLAQAFVTEYRVRNTEYALTITNIVDASVRRRRHGYFFYLLSKKALLDFTFMAAAEWGAGVRVNAVCPGTVSESVDGAFDEAYRQQKAALLPLGRAPEPRDVAEAVRLLIETPALTGQALWVDGGGNLITSSCGLRSRFAAG